VVKISVVFEGGGSGEQMPRKRMWIINVCAVLDNFNSIQ
jgi:hypothetical protein